MLKFTVVFSNGSKNCYRQFAHEAYAIAFSRRYGFWTKNEHGKLDFTPGTITTDSLQFHRIFHRNAGGQQQ